MSAVPGKSWGDGNATFISNDRPFSPKEQEYIGRQAQSAWQLGVVFGQFFHIWSARTLRQSIFTHGVFKNPVRKKFLSDRYKNLSEPL